MDTKIATLISLSLFCNFGTKYIPSSIAQMKLIYKTWPVSPVAVAFSFSTTPYWNN